jgi:hypothetical protein
MTATEKPAFTDPVLLAYQERIAELRRVRCHVTASIMRDELLNQIECWLDPEGMTVMRNIRAAQGKAALALSLEIDPACGF